MILLLMTLTFNDSNIGTSLKISMYLNRYIQLILSLFVETIRKKITTNYRTILDEMQITLAKETLLTCIGNVASIKDDIMPSYGHHKKRMHKFLQFILQEDHNVMQFEKVLKQNALEYLLHIPEKSQSSFMGTKDIGKVHF